MSAPCTGTAPEPQSATLPSARSLRTVCVLIPAWQPTSVLPALVGELIRRGFETVVVVDDGSSAAFQPVFEQVMAFPQVRLRRHPVNRGKGCALKTGFESLLNLPMASGGVVTADADGQHTAADIERVGRALLESGLRPVFGTRRFGQNVPLRSRIGNLLTRSVVALLTRIRVSDTQTGLRGLPQLLLPELLSLPGERYEYEMTALMHLCRTGQQPLEVPIQTVYLENNSGSHFHPVRDSVRIYLALLRSWKPPRRP